MFRIILITIMAVLLLGTMFCSRNPGSNVGSTDVSLQYGETFTYGPDKIKIKFDSLLTDSRCPNDLLIECFWQGMAAIQISLITQDDDTVYIVTSIEGLTQYPEMDSYPAIDTLGLSIELLKLDPYPTEIVKPPHSEYKALLRVKPSVAGNGIDGRIIIVATNVNDLLRDDYIIDSAKIENDLLTVSVAYGGGCKTHYFFAYVPNFLYLSNPPQMDLYLHHFGNDDSCKAYIHQDLKFDMTPVANLMRDGGTDVIIRLIEVQNGEPVLKSTILYKIE